MNPTYVLTYDVGTTACKTCLYEIGTTITLIDSALGEYPLITIPGGGVEQEVDAWWGAIIKGTKAILDRGKVPPTEIKGIAFCTQVQATIMVDKDGKALYNPLIWLDARSTSQIKKYVQKGIKIEGLNARKLLKFLSLTGGIAGTAKDPVWKYLWLKENKPEVFKATYKWLDVCDYLTLRCTGNFARTYDSAHLTWVYNTTPGKLGWSPELCKMCDVNMEHLPKVIPSNEVVGPLTPKSAAELGLPEGIPVFGGGGDVSLIPLGAGCMEVNDTHIYVGTSGWVTTTVNTRLVDIPNFIAGILGAIPGHYSYIAEQETSGICLQWVRDHLALDEIGLYLKAKNVCDVDEKYESLYDFLNETVSLTPPGAGNVLFTPWLHGNRAPREDPYVRGMFFNIGIDTGKRQLIRAVLEGVAYNSRWMLEAIEKKVPHRNSLRFVGGGAKSDIWAQIMADILGRKIEVIDHPQNAGTIGAAIVCAVGLGLYKSFPEAKKLIPVKKTFLPRQEFKALYDHNFKVYTQLYDNNKKLYKILNATNEK